MNVVDLDGDLDWTEFPIPGGNIPARIATLHVDAVTRGRTLLVRFPDGFRRDAVGWYECAEELVVLDGALEMSGRTYRPNEWAWIPAGAPRRDTVAAPFLLAVARFDGPARWVPGEGDSREPVLHEPLNAHPRVLREGSAWLVNVPPGAAPRDTELVSIATRTWARVSAGERFPALEGPCFCRTVGAS